MKRLLTTITLSAAMSAAVFAENATVTIHADQGKQKDLFPDISEDDKQVMALLHKNTDGLQINQIAMELGKPVSATSAHLMKMEFAGLVRCLPGNLYKLS